MDGPNVVRRMVVGPIVTNSIRARLQNLARCVLLHFPGRLRRLAIGIGYRLRTALKLTVANMFLRDIGADLLFCPFTAPTYFETSIPTVCTVYDLQYKAYPEFFAPEDVTERDRAFMEASRRATMLTAISDYSRETAIQHGKIEPTRIRTIHLRMAQRLASQPCANHELLPRFGLTVERYLIYPANFWKHKNHEMLLTGFGMACYSRLAADIKLVCTGAPCERQSYLVKAAQAMNLSKRVIFPGYLSNEEFTCLLVNARGMIFPSLYEGFGLPVIEAMAAGIPVACSNTTSLPEIATNAAILFDPRVPTHIAASIITLVNDKDTRSRLIQAGKKRAAEFADSDRMAREYWELFLQALSNYKRRNQLTGVFPDGWAGPNLNLQIAPANSALTLEMELSAPEWLPQKRFTVQACSAGKLHGSPLVFDRGTNALFTLPIEPYGGDFEIRIAPSFVPANYGQSVDQRELSVVIHRCKIVVDNSSSINLFPEESIFS